jgi:Sec-independent protein translocase protein TatA
MPDLVLLLLIVLILVLLWRGPKTLPKLGEALGRGVREARREVARSDAPEPPADPATPIDPERP